MTALQTWMVVCTPSGYPDLTPVNYMGVSFFVLVQFQYFQKQSAVSSRLVPVHLIS